MTYFITLMVVKLLSTFDEVLVEMKFIVDIFNLNLCEIIYHF